MRGHAYTIAEAIARGDRIWGYCIESSCRHMAVLDLLALRDRLGPDHGALRADLVPKLRCSKCGSRQVGIFSTPGTKEYGGNPYREVSDGRE